MIHNITEIMKNVNGASFVGVDTITNVPLKGGKKNEMQGRVTKKVTGSSVMVFQNKTTNAYENMVNRRLEAEGKSKEDFVLQPRVWGERIPNSPFIVHTNKNDEIKYYLEVIFLKAGKSEYFLDGQPINKENIIGLDDKPEGEQGGLDNKVIIRSYGVENIVGLRIDNEQYEGSFVY